MTEKLDCTAISQYPGKEIGSVSADSNLPFASSISMKNLQSLIFSEGIIDSRSVRASHYADHSCKGIDGNKKVKGRKEHIVVDTLGLPMAVAVHEAMVQLAFAQIMLNKFFQ